MAVVVGEPEAACGVKAESERVAGAGGMDDKFVVGLRRVGTVVVLDQSLSYGGGRIHVRGTRAVENGVQVFDPGDRPAVGAVAQSAALTAIGKA